MQWGQIKTLFILCFLLLDIYLLFLFFEKEKNEDLSTLDRPDLTIEEQLDSENITIPDDLPEELSDEAYLFASQKRFSDEEIEMLSNLGAQDIAVIDNLIVSKFKETVSVSEEASDNEIEQIVKSHVIFPGEFALEYWNKELNVLVFFQQKNGRPVYFNQNGLLLVFLNGENEITAYTQSMLGEPETDTDKKSLVEPIIAIGALYDKYQLYPGEEVTNLKIGYHTMFPLDNGVQVFVPTWKITVNDERNHFVNAIENAIYPSNEVQFIEEVINKNLEKVRLIDEKQELKEDMVRILLEKYEAINRSEKE